MVEGSVTHVYFASIWFWSEVAIIVIFLGLLARITYFAAKKGLIIVVTQKRNELGALVLFGIFSLGAWERLPFYSQKGLISLTPEGLTLHAKGKSSDRSFFLKEYFKRWDQLVELRTVGLVRDRTLAFCFKEPEERILTYRDCLSVSQDELVLLLEEYIEKYA